MEIVKKLNYNKRNTLSLFLFARMQLSLAKQLNGYHKSAVLLKTPIKKVNYDTIHKRIQRTGNFIV